MLSLARNQSLVFYKQYLGQTEVTDQYGTKLGVFEPSYGELKSAMLCVSPAKGDVSNEPFGSLIDYDKSMSTSDTSCDINEDSILWIDGADTSGQYNYYVKKRAPWKNSILFAIKEVDVSAEENNQP